MDHIEFHRNERLGLGVDYDVCDVRAVLADLVFNPAGQLVRIRERGIRPGLDAQEDHQA